MFRLYHGTDARILSMTEEQRIDFKKNILFILDYWWNVLGSRVENKLVFDIDEFRPILGNDLFDHLYFMLGLYNQHRQGASNSSFLHEDNVTYLTSDFNVAKNYALDSFAFGEIGRCAYYVHKSLSKVYEKTEHFNMEIMNVGQQIVQFAEDKPYPVVYLININSLDSSLLTSDCGTSIEEYINDPMYQLYTAACKYSGELYMSPKNENAIYLLPKNEILRFLNL